VRQLAEMLARHRRRRGAAKLAEIIATGPAPTRSELEDVVLDLILRGGHVHPDVNVPYYVEGRRVIPDFRWPEQRLVLEADSATWHDNPLARADDAERQALLEAHGERVLRVTWAQAIARPGPTLARLRAAGAPYTERPMISTNQLRMVHGTTSRPKRCLTGFLRPDSRVGGSAAPTVRSATRGSSRRSS
jgi:very-short-patch-repair endonuclease